MRSITLSILAAALATAANAGPNLVQNGGFETIVNDPGYSHEFGASYIYGQTVSGWTSPDNQAFNLVFYPGQATGPTNALTRFGENGQYLWSATLSPNGGNFVALDGDTGQASPVGQVDGQYNGPLQQTINGLTVGHKYTVSFYYAAAQYADRSGPTTDTLYVNFGSQTGSTGLLSNVSHGFSGWNKWSQTFTTSSASQLLSFLNVGAPNGLPPVVLLDGVSVSENVPEPGMVALLGLGLAGVAVASRRRSR